MVRRMLENEIDVENILLASRLSLGENATVISWCGRFHTNTVSISLSVMHRKMQQNDDVENRTLSNGKGQMQRCELSQYDTFQLIAG